jgi:predicted lipoprotein with Yx(FWY)xxD motif
VAGAAKPAKSKASAPSHQVVVKVTTIASLGQVLTTTTGLALYTYGPDRKNHSNCDSSCLTAWPALSVSAKVRPTGAKGLGTFRRSSTVFQVTYHGLPLYTFASDSAGTVTGNGVGNFHVVIVKAATAVPTSGTTSTTLHYGY